MYIDFEHKQQRNSLGLMSVDLDQVIVAIKIPYTLMIFSTQTTDHLTMLKTPKRKESLRLTL